MNARHHRRVPLLKDLRDFDAAFDGAFSLVAFIMNRHLIDHMLRAARLLSDSDLESLILWGVLAHQNTAHLMPPGSVPTAVLNERGLFDEVTEQLRPVLLRDLSAITGIPRETTRRKLEALAKQQIVERKGRGWVVSVVRLDPELREHTRESAWRLMATASEMLDALRHADQAARPAADAASGAPGGGRGPGG